MRSQSPYTGKESGFTLMELLLAVGIFSVISIGAFRLIDDGLRNIELADQRYEEFSLFSRCVNLLDQSLQQAIARPVREGYGDILEAFTGDSTSLEFTHFGWGNPVSNWQGDLKRSRFATNLIESDSGFRDVWELKQWQVLDRAYDSNSELIISCDFEQLELRYAGAQDEWYNSWPVSDLDNSKSRMPLAVELTMIVPGFGETQRIFTVGGQYRQREKRKPRKPRTDDGLSDQVREDQKGE